MRTVAQRNLEAGTSGSAMPIERRLYLADGSSRPVGSPARALHGSLERHLDAPAPAVPQGTVAQRVGMIALCAGLAWSAIGSGAFFLIH